MNTEGSMETEFRRLGKYELQKRLAHGGMGEVWEALDTQLQRRVAVKLLRTDLQHDPEFLTRFQHEARFIASLRHPNIMQIHDFRISYPPESENTIAYMIMDYVQGQTLADYIRQTSRKGQYPSAEEIIYLFTGISLALNYAHERGMVHRDIKPSNILLDERPPLPHPLGKPVLIDFGIARLQGVATGTVVGALLGTPHYISPEQARSQSGDKRSDLYSLGIILYELTTGITPFRGETAIAVLMQHTHDIPTPPALINPNIPVRLSQVILKSIAKKPDDRFQSASDLTIALADALHVPIPKAFLSTKRPTINTNADMLRTSAPRLPAIPPESSRPVPAVETLEPNQAPALPISPIQANPATPAANSTQIPFMPVITSPQPGPSQAQHNYAIPQNQPAPTQAPYNPAVPQSQQTPPQALHLPSPVLPPASRATWLNKKYLIALVLLAIIVLLVPLSRVSFSPPTQTQTRTPTTVGQLQFTRSTYAIPGNYDQVQIDLHNVPPPPVGKVYYAWLEVGNLENAIPHWKLPINNGTIHQIDLTYPGYGNLLQANRSLLITEEDANSQPSVPYTLLSAHRYYATLSQKSPPTFDIQPCPTNKPPAACL